MDFELSKNKTFQKLQKIKDMTPPSKKMLQLVTLLKDFDTEEISLIADCLLEVSELKKTKRLALWQALKTFLKE